MCWLFGVGVRAVQAWDRAGERRGLAGDGERAEGRVGEVLHLMRAEADLADAQETVEFLAAVHQRVGEAARGRPGRAGLTPIGGRVRLVLGGAEQESGRSRTTCSRCFAPGRDAQISGEDWAERVWRGSVPISAWVPCRRSTMRCRPAPGLSESCGGPGARIALRCGRGAQRGG
ncbi:hypothetical protein GCM10027440_02280 [Nocardiopsis coralliicola]